MNHRAIAATLAVISVCFCTDAWAQSSGTSPELRSFGVVRLHIHSSEPVQIFEHGTRPPTGAASYSFDTRALVCSSPCGRVIDGTRGQEFTARGDFPGSMTFTLDAMKGDVNLTVRPGSRRLYEGGIGTTIVGGAGILGGALILIIGSQQTVSYPLSGGGARADGWALPAGIGALAGGTVAVVGGILMIVFSMIVFSRASFELKQATAAAQNKVKPYHWIGEF